MGEAQRFLRYAMPGSVTVLIFATWIMIDARLCQCYGPIGFDVVGGLAIIAAATLPLGFVAAQLASVVAWFGWRWWFVESTVGGSSLPQASSFLQMTCLGERQRPRERTWSSTSGERAKAWSPPEYERDRSSI